MVIPMNAARQAAIDMINNESLSLTEVAHLGKVSDKTSRQWAARGLFPTFRIGTDKFALVRVWREDIPSELLAESA